jgi:hypothetical protein
MNNKYKFIKEICEYLDTESLENAKNTLNEKYPFSLLHKSGKKHSEYQKTRIFIRDGFIDRYSGERMVFPPVLRLLSKLMPNEFPFQKNWKMSECHIAYWQLLPTIDHVVPVSRGGKDKESNLVCTSQLRNSAKSNWLLEELDWKLHKAGNVNQWDGLMKWLISYVNKNPKVIVDQYINAWFKAALKASEISDNMVTAADLEITSPNPTTLFSDSSSRDRRFTLVKNQWYACEIIGDEFVEDKCSYSPIRVDQIKPLGNGNREFLLRFYHANYPEGIRNKEYRLRSIERAATFLIAESVEHTQKRIFQIYDIDNRWMERHFKDIQLRGTDCKDWLNSDFRIAR